MDPAFFGLEGHPFPPSGGREELSYREAYASLITELRAGLKAPHGITLVIGEEGAGKTPLIRSFAEDLADSCTVAFLPTTGPGLRHLLVEAIEQLGGSSPPSGDENALIEALRVLSRARARHERSTLLIVDDAHELPAKTIERLGKLFGDDPAEPTRLHVLLVGRPELLDRMNAANDRTILKHLVQVCRVDPIGPEDSCRYIAGRVAKVGGAVDSLFTQEALRLIVARAGGNPARIDAICSAALERAQQRGDNPIGPDIVDLACSQASGGSDPGASSGNGEGDSPFYVFGDDDDDDENDTPAAPSRRSGGANGARRGSGGSGRGLKALYQSRRPFVLAAGGLIVVLGVFAATMTETGPRQSLERVLKKAPQTLAGLKKAQEEPPAPAPPAERGSPVKPRQDASAGSSEVPEDSKAAAPERPVTTPKLVVHRDRTDAQPAASGDEPPAAAPAPQQDEVRTASAPVHAAPRKRVEPPPAVAPQPEAPASVVKDTAPAPAPGSVAEPAGAPPPPPLVVAVAKPEQIDAPPTAAPAPPRPALAPPLASPAPRPAPAVTLPSVVASAAPAPKPAAATVPAPVVAAAAPVPKPAVAAPPPVPVVATAAPSGSAAVTTGGGFRFSVQIGAFKGRENAEALLVKANGVFKDATIASVESGGTTVFRVLSGSFATKADADSRAQTLAQSGFTTYVRAVLP